jgi:hypothetical protein
MTPWWLVSYVALWLVVLSLGFLLLGALRALGLLRWRLEQLEATTPSRIGLKPGKKAPDFTLPCVAGGEISLHDRAGRRVFLVFTQSGLRVAILLSPSARERVRGPGTPYGPWLSVLTVCSHERRQPRDRGHSHVRETSVRPSPQQFVNSTPRPRRQLWPANGAIFPHRQTLVRTR